MTDKEMQDVKVRLITGLYSRGDVSMVFAEIERLQSENARLQAERERGCEYCDDPDCPPLDWRCGLDHILPDYKHCPMCGRKLNPSEST